MELNFKSNKKKLLKHLMSIYGLGHKRSLRIHKLLGVNLRLSSFYLLNSQKEKLVYRLNRLVILQKLKKYLYKIHNFAYKIRLRKGIRNRIGLPSRGQQTKTNAKTKQKLKN